MPTIPASQLQPGHIVLFRDITTATVAAVDREDHLVRVTLVVYRLPNEPVEVSA